MSTVAIIFENKEFIGVAETIRKGDQLIEEQFCESTVKGRFTNNYVKGEYTNEPQTYRYGKKVVVAHQYQSTCDEDPVYLVVPFELNELRPGCENLPTTRTDA